MKKILLADSGSTKTDWCLIEAGVVLRRFLTRGINPFYQTCSEIVSEMQENLLPHLQGESIDAIYFYGAGCAFPEKNAIVRTALGFCLPAVEAIVHKDLLAAARSLCGRTAGIACILGTGSNSCFYDGEEIIHNVPPLGFILGDEGSGAVLGRLLVGDCLKGQLPPSLSQAFLSQYGLTPELILEHVYKKSFPNRFLANLTPFLSQHIDHPAIYRIVWNSFTAFLERNVKQYDYLHCKVHFTGSIAYYFQSVLQDAARQAGVSLGTISQSPMPGLVAYHSPL